MESMKFTSFVKRRVAKNGSQNLPKVKIIMQISGAAYMLYLAWKVWKSPVAPEADSGEAASFLSGMVLQFANPKIFYCAIALFQ